MKNRNNSHRLSLDVKGEDFLIRTVQKTFSISQKVVYK